jgi:4-amino-4-deoxy-L-arabinose transferase-like glycosyltransferase
MLRRFIFPAVLLMAAALLYLSTAGGYAILDDGDALYAHIAQQMARSGEWVTPYANGVRFLDKPPMMYWLMGFAYRMFGFDEFAARLPSVLAVLGIGIILFSIGKKWATPSAGLIAGAASTFCIGAFLFTRMVFPDVLFVFFLTLSLGAFLGWYQDERNPVFPAMIFYASAAGAVLSKGLIGLVFPTAIILLFLLWSGKLRRLLHFKIWQGSLLFIALTLPWHVLAAQRNPGFLWYYFINEQVLRFLGKRQPFDYESISLPIFWALVLVWLFPWSAFFPSICRIIRNTGNHQEGVGNTIRLALSWIIVVLVFFSFSSRIEHYSMPIFPPLALLAGIVLSPEKLFSVNIEYKCQRSVGRGFAFLGILGGILALAFIAALLWIYGWLPGLSFNHGGEGRLHAYKYYFAPLFDMPPETLSRLVMPAIGTCIVFAAGLLIAWWTNRRGLRLTAVAVLVLMMSGFCLFAFQSLGICEEMISSKKFGQELNRIYRPGDETVVIGDFETANSVNFYSPVILKVYKGSAALLYWGSRYPDAPQLLVSHAQLEEKWSSSRRIFLIAPVGRNLNLSPTYVVMRSGSRVLLSNKKTF